MFTGTYLSFEHMIEWPLLDNIEPVVMSQIEELMQLIFGEVRHCEYMFIQEGCVRRMRCLRQVYSVVRGRGRAHNLLLVLLLLLVYWLYFD